MMAVEMDMAMYRPSRSEPVNIPLPKGLTEIPPKVFEKGNAAVGSFIKSNRQLYLERLRPYLRRSLWNVAIPTARCFVYPRSDSEEVVEQRWDLSLQMPVSEFHSLIAYDVGRFLFQDRELSEAEKMFEIVSSAPSAYASASQVTAYLTACRGVPKTKRPRHQLQELMEEVSIRTSEIALSDELVSKFCAILLTDTLSRRGELSRIERDDVELNLNQHPRLHSLQFAVTTANLLHRVMDGQALLNLYAEKVQREGEPGVALLLSCLGRCLKEARENEAMNLKCFVWYLIQALPDDSQFTVTLLNTEVCARHFDAEERAVIRQQLTGKSLEESADAFLELEDVETRDEEDPWFVEEEYEEEDAVDSGPSGASAVDAMRLLTSYDPEEIRILIERLLDGPSSSFTARGLARLSDKWRVRPEALERQLLNQASSSLSSVFLFVLTAKAQLLRGLEEWEGAFLLMTSAVRVAETEGAGARIVKMLRHELVLLSMQSYLSHEKFLGGGQDGLGELAHGAKSLLTGLRIEGEGGVGEEAAVTAVVFLLSTGCGSYLVELRSAIGPPQGGRAAGALILASMLHRLGESEGMTRPACRDLWDFLSRCLPITGQPGVCPLSRDLFLLFLRLVRERRHISLLLSALIAMCKQQLTELNILIHPGNKALIEFWPSGGCMNVSQDALQESVNLLLDSGLAKFPNECSWLLTRAELAYSQRHYKRALVAYLECGAAATDFFSQSVPEELFSRQTLQRMLRCCQEMRYYGQATVMCQLATTDQGETDYKSAVRFLKMQEESLDTIDSYLSFIWDVTLLELAAAISGQRYGAVEKRARIVAAIGRPEVNMASKADVKYNVEVQRRLGFMRLMCEQHFL